MSIVTKLYIEHELELFELTELKRALELAASTNGKIFTYKTSGKFNWLEEGVSITDTLGLVILPCSFSGTIDMPNDIIHNYDRI